MASAKFELGWWGRGHSGVKPCRKVWNFDHWPVAEVPFLILSLENDENSCNSVVLCWWIYLFVQSVKKILVLNMVLVHSPIFFRWIYQTSICGDNMTLKLSA